MLVEDESTVYKARFPNIETIGWEFCCSLLHPTYLQTLKLKAGSGTEDHPDDYRPPQFDYPVVADIYNILVERYMTCDDDAELSESHELAELICDKMIKSPLSSIVNLTTDILPPPYKPQDSSVLDRVIVQIDCQNVDCECIDESYWNALIKLQELCTTKGSDVR